MQWVYDGDIHATLTIPFYTVGTPKIFKVRLASEEGESLPRAFLSLTDPNFVGYIWGRVYGTTKWYRIGYLWDSECYIGSIDNWSFEDIEIKIDVPSSVDSGPYRLWLTCLYGEEDPGPNRNFCALEAEDNAPLWGDDEFETPLWSGSQGGCPGYEIGSNCGVPVYGHAIPAASISKYNIVTTYLDGVVKKVKKADTDSIQNATAVGIFLEDSVSIPVIVGAGTATSADGRYVYEQGGQEVDENGDPTGVFHPEIRMTDTQTGIVTVIGTCGETEQQNETLIIVNGILYIFGGDDGAGSYYKSLYGFTLSTLQCTQLEDAPVERATASAISNENEIHYLGGYNADGVVTAVDIYDIPSGHWLVPIDYPEGEPVTDPDTGDPVTDPDTGDPVVYPSPGDSTSPFPTNPPNPSGLGVIAGAPSPLPSFMSCLNGTLYAWSIQEGVQAHTYSSTGTVSDRPASPSFPSVLLRNADMGRFLTAAAVTYNGKIYVCNPFSYESAADPAMNMCIYTPGYNSWQVITDSLPPSQGYSYENPYGWLYGAAVSGTKIYYWGTNHAAPYTETPHWRTYIFIFDASNNTWDQTLHTVATNVSMYNGARGSFYGDIVGNFLYLYGGYDNGSIPYAPLTKINLSDFSVTRPTAYNLPTFTYAEYMAKAIGNYLYYLSSSSIGYVMTRLDTTTMTWSVYPKAVDTGDLWYMWYWYPPYAVCNNKIYISGSYVWDPAGATTVIMVPGKSYFFTGADGKVYSIRVDLPRTQGSTYAYDPNTRAWGYRPYTKPLGANIAFTAQQPIVTDQGLLVGNRFF